MQFRYEIQGLRAISVVAVILEHAGLKLISGGFVGVDVFFVLSGFLITNIILEDLRRDRFSLANFYSRRARRILPALLLVILASLPFAWALMLPEEMVNFAQSVLATLFFVSNMYFASFFDYFAPDAGLVPMLHMWSLSVEEQYYLIFPLAVMLIWRFARGLLPWALALGVIGGLALSILGTPRFPQEAFFWLPFRAFELLIGALLAATVGPTAARAPRAVAEAGSLLGLSMIAGSMVLMTPETPFPGYAALAPTVGAALVIAFAQPGVLAQRMLSTGPMVLIGAISYSAYLWHQPLLAFARLANPDLIGHPVLIAVGLAALPLAWLTWRFVEEPFRKPSRVPRRPFVAVTAGGAALATAAMAALTLTGGYPQRLPEPVLAADAAFVAVDEARLEAIRSGVCHFNERGVTRDRADFIAQWDCMGDGRAMVVGDSHAADKAMALRLAGVDSGQMTGANCSLTPRRMRPECRAIFQALKQRLRDAGWNGTLVLSNALSERELQPDWLAEAFDYWRRFPHERIVIVGSMPTFGDVRQYLLKTMLRDRLPDWRTIPATADFSARDSNAILSDAAETRALYAADGVGFVSSRDLYCAIADLENCGLILADGALAQVNEGHLSVEGAARFGPPFAQALGLRP